MLKLEKLKPSISNSQYEEIKGLMNSNLFILKNMSDLNKPSHDFRFLDESEWRILYWGKDDSSDILPNIIPSKANSDNVPKIKFEPKELRVLVFPDEKTREISLNDDEIFNWFGRNIPIMATVEECLNF
ncbi:TPA: hypothetical protein ENS27_05885 [bacterium]|nr:hypothetical protein [bacterium]